jgi:hypothetical protein
MTDGQGMVSMEKRRAWFRVDRRALRIMSLSLPILAIISAVLSILWAIGAIWWPFVLQLVVTALLLTLGIRAIIEAAWPQKK